MIKHLWNIIEAKPLIGYTLAGQGGIAGLLVLLQWLTPIIGFVSAMVGLAAAIITIVIKIRDLKNYGKPPKK
jgi:hypothetical protein